MTRPEQRNKINFIYFKLINNTVKKIQAIYFYEWYSGLHLIQRSALKNAGLLSSSEMQHDVCGSQMMLPYFNIGLTGVLYDINFVSKKPPTK